MGNVQMINCLDLYQMYEVQYNNIAMENYKETNLNWNFNQQMNAKIIKKTFNNEIKFPGVCRLYHH